MFIVTITRDGDSSAIERYGADAYMVETKKNEAGWYTTITVSDEDVIRSLSGSDGPEDEDRCTGFVICVNDEPYVDTFRDGPSMAWQAFLPILEADPSLGNEDVRLVKLVEE